MSTLVIKIIQVLTSEDCAKSFDVESFQKLGIPSLQIERQFLYGLTPEVSCVSVENFIKRSCPGDPGSPAIVAVTGTARGEVFFEQHFVLSKGFDCKLSSMLYTRVSSRKVLNWIQKVTGDKFKLNENHFVGSL
jgi:hypothetical protein